MATKSQDFSQSDYLKRLKVVQDSLKKWQVDACLIEQPVDLFYLLGLQLSLGSLIVSQKGSALFVDGRYTQVAHENSPVPVRLLEDSDFLAFVSETGIKRLGFDSQYTTVDRLTKIEKLGTCVPIPSPLKNVRAIKESKEQLLLRKSALLLNKGFKHIVKKLKTGITEKELALEFEIFCLQNGAEKLSFEPIIAFGPNSAMPHYRSGNRKLKPGDIVLIDIGVVYHSYCSDMTRVVFWKKPSSEMQRLLDIVKESQKAAIAKCAPGVTLSTLDKATRAVMQKENLEEYYVHSLGHGIGLQVHEFPRVGIKTADKDLVLKAGMVITIEPGIYLPGKGGARYEDMILITEDGCKKLT